MPEFKVKMSKPERKKEIKRIICTERIKQIHRIVRYCITIKDVSSPSPLSSVDIPDTPVHATCHVDPKTWQGPWRVLTKPDDIDTRICEANVAQYHQAHETPFGQEPLSHHFGANADKKGSQQLLKGQLPGDTIKDQLLSETQAILRALARMSKISTGNLDCSISSNKFKSVYTAMNKYTSSSPSGRHLGHYKAALTSDHLVKLHTNMMAIPHLTGYPPKKWHEIVDAMLQKTPDDSRIHRLRTVALLESDFNQSNRLAIGKPVLEHLEDIGALTSMQYGSWPAKFCLSAILNKQLSIEIVRYRKSSMAYIENDTIGCYHRIINPLVLLYLRLLGVPLPALQTLATSWSQSSHRVKTLYGISTQRYTNSTEYFLYGPGQGSTIGPILWLICFLLMWSALLPNLPCMTFSSVDKYFHAKSKGDAFVDDTGLGCTSDNKESTPQEDTKLIKDLHKLAQEWELLLFSTGGALNLQKCFWF
jgi:hypothetical protein